MEGSGLDRSVTLSKRESSLDRSAGLSEKGSDLHRSASLGDRGHGLDCYGMRVVCWYEGRYSGQLRC